MFRPEPGKIFTFFSTGKLRLLQAENVTSKIWTKQMGFYFHCAKNQQTMPRFTMFLLVSHKSPRPAAADKHFLDVVRATANQKMSDSLVRLSCIQFLFVTLNQQHKNHREKLFPFRITENEIFPWNLLFLVSLRKKKTFLNVRALPRENPFLFFSFDIKIFYLLSILLNYCFHLFK